jgi:hypothetical protein
MKFNRHVALAPAAILAFTCFCGDNKPSEPSADSTSGKVLTTTSGYTVSTGTSADSIDTMRTLTPRAASCAGIDSGAPAAGAYDSAKYMYRLRNDSLLVQNDAWTLSFFPTQFFIWAFTGVKVWYVFLGSHDAGSITGTWGLVGAVGSFGPNVTLGAAQAADSIIASKDSLIRSYGMTITMSGDMLKVYYTMKFADSVVAAWTTCRMTSLDTCHYDMTVTKVSDNTVTLYGKISRSAATISEDGFGNVTYTSTNPEYGPHTYYANPIRCPNQSLPVWWTQFLSINLKP